MITDILFLSAIFLIGIAVGTFIDICVVECIICTKNECEYRTYDEV